MLRSKREREILFEQTGQAESVHYWDAANDTLDLRPISRVYGVQNLYRDCRNTENMNVVEEKLAELERKAADVINELHKALPTNRFSVTRRPLEDLRKFLFIMYYRLSVIKDTYFDENHPENTWTKLWIEKYKETRGFQSSAETWVHMLGYFLDNSHSQLMEHGGIVLKYVSDDIRKFRTNQVPPDIEHFPAFAYLSNCGKYFACIWQAAVGEEFVLTNTGFGLWEGLMMNEPSIHRIYVISPRIVIVLRSNELPHAIQLQVSISSSLMGIEQDRPEVKYHATEHWMGGGVDQRGSKQADEDVFTFNVKKLTAFETMEVNAVLLENVPEDGSITFASKACMLRTARTFCTLPQHFKWKPMISKLVKTLEKGTTSDEPCDTNPLELVHFELFELLLDISTENKTFTSEYDRARKILYIILGQTHISTDFMSEIYHRVITISAYFLEDCDGEPLFSPNYWVETLPLDGSTPLFSMLFMIMQVYGFGHTPTGNILDTVRDEAVALLFLKVVSTNPKGWYKLTTSHPCAGPTLSCLVDEGSTADAKMINLMIRVTENSGDFKSSYDRAVVLHGAICMSGPMGNNLTSSCAWQIAYIIKGLATVIPYGGLRRSVRPRARLTDSLSQAHWLALARLVRDSMGRARVRFDSGSDEVPLADADEMEDDIVIVGILMWMARRRADFLDEFCRSKNIPLVKD